MFELPQKLQNLTPYQPLSGQFAVRLDANESFLTPPDWLRQEIAQAVAAVDFNRYPDPYCTQLCARFADYFDVDAASLVAGNGSDELIGLIISSFTVAGDRLVVVSPDFSMYAFYAQFCGVQVCTFEKPDLALDTEKLIAFTRESSAKLLILSNPCNPTSLSASQADIQKIVTALPDCLVVIDEAYMDFSDGSILQSVADYDNLIVLKTCSKAFGMAAIRLGFAVAGRKISDALRAAKSPYNVNTMTQAAGCVLFSHGSHLDDCTAQIKLSRQSLYMGICTLAKDTSAILSIADTCANFVFLELRDAKGTFDALAKKGIAARLMGAYLRISAGSQAENRAVLAALAEILKEGNQ